ncbi:hypothetical protein KY329_04320, partial [Candidatus Woesearchaeota archaeon]|nr:hypothetical protein [Candidatus Woesearchaeota archaeon]
MATYKPGEIEAAREFYYQNGLPRYADTILVAERFGWEVLKNKAESPTAIQELKFCEELELDLPKGLTLG